LRTLSGRFARFNSSFAATHSEYQSTFHDASPFFRSGDNSGGQLHRLSWTESTSRAEKPAAIQALAAKMIASEKPMALPKRSPGHSPSQAKPSGLGASLPLLIISLVLLLLVSVLCFITWTKYVKSADQTRVSVAVIASLKDVVGWLELAETSQQGYLLTTDARYLKAAARAIPAAGAQMKQTDRLNGWRQQGLRLQREFEEAVQEKSDDLERTLALIHQGHSGSAIERIKGVRGQLLMDRVRGIARELERGEQERLLVARKLSRFYARLSQLVATIGSAGIFGIVLISTIRINRLISAGNMLTTELQRTNEDLRQFVYSASHDLQEPLRNLMIYSDLVEKRIVSGAWEALREDAKFIRLFANRMRALVSDLLAYTQIANAEPTPLEVADMNKVMAKVVDSCSVPIAEAHAAVVSDPLPRLRISETHAEQIMQNLLSNAIKYRRTEVAPVIKVSAERRRSDWIVAIKDNGIGIEPHYHSHIFGIFKRLHTATEYPGTGLGLAICRKIVERHGGNIWVESKPGEGSTFYFSIPGVLSATRGKKNDVNSDSVA
jgi:signal transduction histidine kinase